MDRKGISQSLRFGSDCHVSRKVAADHNATSMSNLNAKLMIWRISMDNQEIQPKII